MSWKLFLDDERMPVRDWWIICRSYDEAVEKCQELGCPEEVAFDLILVLGRPDMILHNG